MMTILFSSDGSFYEKKQRSTKDSWVLNCLVPMLVGAASETCANEKSKRSVQCYKKRLNKCKSKNVEEQEKLSVTLEELEKYKAQLESLKKQAEACLSEKLKEVEMVIEKNRSSLQEAALKRKLCELLKEEKELKKENFALKTKKQCSIDPEEVEQTETSHIPMAVEGSASFDSFHQSVSNGSSSRHQQGVSDPDHFLEEGEDAQDRSAGISPVYSAFTASSAAMTNERGADHDEELLNTPMAVGGSASLDSLHQLVPNGSSSRHQPFTEGVSHLDSHFEEEEDAQDRSALFDHVSFDQAGVSLVHSALTASCNHGASTTDEDGAHHDEAFFNMPFPDPDEEL